MLRFSKQLITWRVAPSLDYSTTLPYTRIDVTVPAKDSTNVAALDLYFAVSNHPKLRRRLLLALLVIGATVFIHTCVFDRATWYGESWRGKNMANGKPYNPDALTCASWSYQLGTTLRITHNGHSVTVQVTDRGGKNRWYQFGKTIDLSPAAFSKLAPLRTGSIKIQIHRTN